MCIVGFLFINIAYHTIPFVIVRSIWGMKINVYHWISVHKHCIFTLYPFVIIHKWCCLWYYSCGGQYLKQFGLIFVFCNMNINYIFLFVGDDDFRLCVSSQTALLSPCVFCFCAVVTPPARAWSYMFFFSFCCSLWRIFGRIRDGISFSTG